VRVAGKTVWSLVNTCHTWALYKSSDTLLYYLHTGWESLPYFEYSRDSHSQFKDRQGTPSDSLNGCWRHICLMIGTAALC